MRFPTETGATQYFFPGTEWKGSKGIGVTCDITYRYEPDASAIYNITFFYPGNANKGSVPSLPSSIVLSGDGVSAAFSDMEILFSNAERKQLRVTSLVSGEALISVLKSPSITLTAVIGGSEYTYSPPKEFLSYRDEFFTAIAR
jgi:hypothetical protein